MDDHIATLGSRITVLTIREIRYEGFLMKVDPKAGIIGVGSVRLFGTEIRAAPQHVAPWEKIITFLDFQIQVIKSIFKISAFMPLPGQPESNFPPQRYPNQQQSAAESKKERERNSANHNTPPTQSGAHLGLERKECIIQFIQTPQSPELILEQGVFMPQVINLPAIWIRHEPHKPHPVHASNQGINKRQQASSMQEQQSTKLTDIFQDILKKFPITEEEMLKLKAKIQKQNEFIALSSLKKSHPTSLRPPVPPKEKSIDACHRPDGAQFGEIMTAEKHGATRKQQGAVRGIPARHVGAGKRTYANVVRCGRATLEPDNSTCDVTYNDVFPGDFDFEEANKKFQRILEREADERLVASILNDEPIISSMSRERTVQEPGVAQLPFPRMADRSQYK